MDSLLVSRMNKDVSPTKLLNLSPDKYGKAAWAELTYTPSKLADNIIYREATTLRKTEEGSSKLRELEAMNGFIKERMNQLELERDGIQKSLAQQIAMYKKMLHESDTKNQIRLLQIQKRFNSEISMLIKEKEEEAKFSQAQQEILEDRIAELEAKLKDSEEREANLNFDFATLKGNFQKLDIQNEHLKLSLTKLQKERTLDLQQWRKSKEDYNQQIKLLQKKCESQLQGLLKQKNKEKDALQRLMKTQMEKLQNIRANDNLRKTQQMRDVMTTFQNQSKRLNEIIAMKDRMLQSLTYQNTKNKQNILQITASYQSRFNNLTNNRNDLTQQVEKGISRIAMLQSELQSQITSRAQEKERLGQVILDLKEELERTQINYIRDRDHYEYWGTDLEKEIIMLQNQNKRMADVMGQNDKLASELRKLRDLLVQSSFQIEKSKQQLMRMSFDRDTLSMKVQKLMSENEKLYRMARDVEDESARMRNQYYTQQRQYYR